MTRDAAIDFNTAKAAFEICKSEYENERKRTNTIDTKVSILVVLVGVLIPFAVQTKIGDVLYQNDGQNVITGLLSVISFLTLTIFSVFTVIFLYKSLSKRNYYTLDLEYYIQWDHLQIDSMSYYIACSYYYNEAGSYK